MLDGVPERLDRLPREVAAALVDCGEREPERHVRLFVERCDDRRLRVERVETVSIRKKSTPPSRNARI
jgi:hypothetical protein